MIFVDAELVLNEELAAYDEEQNNSRQNIAVGLVKSES